MDYKILKEVSLIDKKATGKTRHIVGGNQFTAFYKLQIVQYEESKGFYLFYLDNNNEVITDTFHDTIEEAEDQANFEFLVKQNDWHNILLKA